MALSPDQAERVQQLIEKYGKQQDLLLPILHDIQDAVGYIPDESLSWIAQWLNISAAEVHGVISFYHFFRRKPAGRSTLQICRAESCQAVGARDLESFAKKELGIRYHQTTANGAVTLEPVYCLGNCACSPAVRVGDRILGRMDRQKMAQLIEELDVDLVEVR